MTSSSSVATRPLWRSRWTSTGSPRAGKIPSRTSRAGRADSRWSTSRTRRVPPIIGWLTSALESSRGARFSPTGSKRGSGTTSSSAMTRRIRSPASRLALSICAASRSSRGPVGTALRGSRRWLSLTILALIVSIGFGSGSFAAEGVNLVAARNGAQVIKFTSQLDGGGRADQLIDEHEDSRGWAAGDNSLPQEIIFRLPAVLRFNTVVFRQGAESLDQQGAKDIGVYTA